MEQEEKGVRHSQNDEVRGQIDTVLYKCVQQRADLSQNLNNSTSARNHLPQCAELDSS